MNKNVFLISLIGLIVIIYVIDNFYLLTKRNENFDAISDNANGNISNTSNVNLELLDLFKSKIESEIDQITESEIKIETESEIIKVSNTGGLIIIIVIIILMFCCSLSCIMSIFIPSTPPPQNLYSYPPSPNLYSYSPLLSPNPNRY